MSEKEQIEAEKTTDELVRSGFDFSALSGGGFKATMGGYKDDRVDIAFTDEVDLLRFLSVQLGVNPSEIAQ